MQAVLIGATGATGKNLLAMLLNDDTFVSVLVFTRRIIYIVHPKLTVHIIDFDLPENWKHLVIGDVFFSCLGTTLKKAGSRQAQWKVDYTYQYEFAKAARENNITKYVLQSSGLANESSFFHYAKMKGQLEKDVIELNFQMTAIFNPPPLIRKDSERTSELIGIKIISILNKIGILTTKKPMSTDIVPKAMINAAKIYARGIHIHKGLEIGDIQNFTV